METITLSKKIEDKIELLSKMRLEIKERATKKAEAISNYDRKLAIEIITIKIEYSITFGFLKIKHRANIKNRNIQTMNFCTSSFIILLN